MSQFASWYPEELLAAREEKLRGFWAAAGPRALLSVHSAATPYRQLADDDLMVERAVQEILASAHLSDDYLPWFGPDFGTVSTAKYWGGEIVQPEGGFVFIKPVIHGPEDLDRVQPGDPAGYDVARAIRLCARVRERLGTDRVWGRMLDFQGPLSTAALLWEQTDFLCSMYTDPEAVHRLLDQVTTQLIAMMRALRAGMGRLCGMIWPYIWMPDELGIVFTEDMMPLMSPELYREFGIPYMKRLAEAAGGAFLHCCGACEQHLESLAASGAPLRGFDYCEPYTRTEAVYAAFGPDKVYHPMVASEMLDAYGGSYPAYLEHHLAKVAPADMRFWFAFQGEDPVRDATIRRCFIAG